MNVLLLTPPSLQLSFGKIKKLSDALPSIGLAYIGAVLRNNGINVKILDAYAEETKIQDIVQVVTNNQIDLIGISVLTTSADLVEEIVHTLRKEAPSVIVVLGNVHASIFAENILLRDGADIIVHNEGEYTMLDIVQALEKESPLNEIDGISFKQDGKIIHTKSREFISDLDQLPYPAWDLYDIKKYQTDPRTEVKDTLFRYQILATRGCPNQCTFCSSRSAKSLGTKYRMRKPKAIVDEIEHLYLNFGARTILFMDLAFPLVKEHAMAVCQEIIDRGYHKKITWSSECRVKPIDQEMLEKMRESGCIRVNFGIESGQDRILKMIKKGINTTDVRKAVTLANNAGIEVDGLFMIGLPTETPEDIKKTIDFAICLDIRYATFNVFVPFPGSELFTELSDKKLLHYNSWSEFNEYPAYTESEPVYTPETLTHKEIIELQKTALRRFYFRYAFISKEIMRIKPLMLVTYIRAVWALRPHLKTPNLFNKTN